MSGISVHPNAPYSRLKKNTIEGFTTNNIFKDILVIPEPSIVPTIAVPGKATGVTNPQSGTCPPAPPAAGAAAGAAAAGTSVNAYTPPPFLKKLIQDEKNSVESLLRTAAKIGPMTNTLIQSENASDAAFMAKEPAPIPTYGSTLQGFTFILFFWSYFFLAIVVSIYINQTTGSTGNAVGTFVGSMVGLVLIFALMKRYA